ncbi:hypothetical protein [Microbacterium sp. A93]|uniref:hypothetical protein n=1 Tax=Microbacterium sp. A93 TaxID=3450716 RepID=UPI003F43C1BD
MENNAPSTREALDAVHEAREINAQRLRRPRRYWIMFGGILAVFALTPYTTGWPPLVQYLAPAALIIIIGVTAAWKQPTAVRKIRLSGRMVLQLIGFAVVAGVIVGISRALYSEHGWWWLPLIAAIVLFGFVAGIGPRMDRSWARQVSRVEG